MKRVSRILTGLAGGVGLTALSACWGYREAFLRQERRQAPIRSIPAGKSFDPYRADMLSNIDRLLETPYERVTVRSYDSLKLVGKLYEGDPGAPLILFFHGYRSAAERDASGGFQLCRENGWNLLLVDQRSHGESEGKEITFGIRERFDCQTWAEYGAKRFGPETPIFLWGISMGAATVLMASELALPESVRGIAADCGYDAPETIIRETARRRRLPGALIGRIVGLGARAFGGFRLNEASPLDSVTRSKLPILLIHGEADEIVPPSMVRSLERACAAPVTVLTVPNAGHGISWYADQPAYRAALLRFMVDCE